MVRRILAALMVCTSAASMYANESRGKEVLNFAKSISLQGMLKPNHQKLADYDAALSGILTKSSIPDDYQTKYQLAIPLIYQILNEDFEWAVKAHNNKTEYPALRGVYTILWKGLGEKGWALWHDECLESLKKNNKDKRVLYIAGGSDIESLLKSGIYNFDIIDPFPETQNRYYSSDYKTLAGISASSRIGDVYQAPAIDKSLTIIRSDLNATQTYTSWQVYADDGSLLGNFSFSRRYCTQEDLQNSGQIVLSFNELVFLLTPYALGGWDIDIRNLPAHKTIYVKQLPKAFDLQELLNLRTILTLSHVDFRFIGLGSDID